MTKVIVVGWKQVWRMVRGGESVVKVVEVGRKQVWRMANEVESVSMVFVA